MKTFRILGYVLLPLSLCLCACEEIKTPIEPAPDPKPEEVKSEIIIDADIITNGLAFTSEKGEKSISFTTNEDWNLSIAATQTGDAWCTASATNGTKGEADINFSVTENTSYEDRSVAVTIKSGTATKTFTVTQKYADALLLTTSIYELTQEGGTIEIEVKTNIDYEMEIAESAKDWIAETETRALTAHKHTLNISANEEVEKREGEIHFKSGDKTETVKIYQEGGAVILLGKDEYNASSTGDTIYVDIRSNIEFGVQMPDADWITDEPSTRSLSSHTLKYIIAPNEEYDSRTAEIIFFDQNSELKDTLKVIQAQKDAIVISQKTYEVAAEGGVIEVQLSSNIEFEITMPQAGWIEMVETRAFQQHTIYFKIAENPDMFNRTADIVFTNKDNTISDTISITQQNYAGNHKFYGDSKGLYGDVELYKAGILRNILDLYRKLNGDTYLTKLTISGPINGDDIKALNMVYSSNSNFELDLSDATIVEGGGSYYSYKTAYSGYEDYYTADNEIGSYMFAEASYRIINLPKNATTISSYAFYKSGVVTVDTNNGINSISDYAFSGADVLRNIYIGEGVTKLNERAFQECSSLMFLKISISVPSIADYAFRYVPITDVHISNTVTSIGKEAFALCQDLKTVSIGDGVTTIGENAFHDCEALSSVTIGKSVSLIGYGAFDECKSLTSIDIPDSVTHIGDYAFSNTSLCYVDIPNGVTVIGDRAFSGTSLITVVIPDSVTDIGSYTFTYCNKLTRLYCNAIVPPAGNDMLESGVQIFVPHQSVEAYKTSESWQKYADYIVGYDYEQDEVEIDISKCKIGDFINYKGVDCVVFYAEEDAVKLVSASIKSNCEWGLSGTSIGAYDTADGSANAEKAKSKGLFDSLPAFEWCESLGEGWYLPSSGEIRKLYSNRHEVGAALTDMDYSSLMGKEYWSSTETDSSGKYAYSYDFNYYDYQLGEYHSSKNSNKCVRAVMTIKK